MSMKDIAETMPITEGVDRLMTVLKQCGYKDSHIKWWLYLFWRVFAAQVWY